MHRRFQRLSFLAAVVLLAPATPAAEPLHARIDAAWTEGQILPPSPPASDAEFLRRIYLDLTGVIPTPAVARAFLADPSTGKRAALVEQLLATPEYARHMADLFDTAFMERRAATNVDEKSWKQYLYDSFSHNKPYRRLAQELFAADGVAPEQRAPSRFILDRDTQPHLVTRDVARVFFGRDLQCAQCHDHPQIDGYRQGEYQGLFAFFARTFVFKSKDAAGVERAVLAERAESNDVYKSVFEPRWSLTARPQLPGDQPIDDPALPADQLYQVKPADGVRPIPAYSRRGKLAELIGTGQSRQFARTIANRMWAVMMGVGVVEPVDLDHPQNPPSNPKLLDTLTDGMVEVDYDLKAFLRELALTQAYQRSIDPPSPGSLAASFDAAAQRLAQLQTQQQTLAQAAKTTSDACAAAEDAWGASQLAATKLSADHEQAIAAIAQAQKVHDETAKAMTDAQAQATQKKEAQQLLAEAAAKAQEAAAKLPDRAEVAQAAQTLKAQADAAAGEMPAMEQMVSQRVAAMEGAVAALTNAKATHVAAAESLDAARQAAAAATASLDSATMLRGRDQHASLLADREIERLATVLDYRDKMSEAEQARVSLADTDTRLAEHTQALKALEPTLASQQASADQAAASAARAAESLADAENRTASLQRSIDSLKTAGEKLAAALQKAPESDEITRAADELSTQGAALTGELQEAAVQLAQRQQTHESAQAALGKALADRDSSKAQADSLQATLQALAQQRAEIVQRLDAGAARAELAYASLTPHWSRTHASQSLKPLTPEQLAWSLMEATGIAAQYRAVAEAELKQPPAAPAPGDATTPPPAPPQVTPAQVERLTYDKLKGIVDTFVAFYGAGAGQPQDAQTTVDQALFLTNSDTIVNWVKASTSQRLAAIEDPAALAEEAYLAALTRPPTPEEVEAVRQHLETRKEDRAAAVAEVLWGLVSSVEFRFNH